MRHTHLEKQERAKKRVEQLKGFFIHATVYVIINTTLTVVKIVGTIYYGDYFMGPLWHFSTFLSWFFWGIGLSFHAIKVFKLNPFFNKDWEKRQIQKYMQEDLEEEETFQQIEHEHEK